MRMLAANASETETVRDPTLARKMGSYSELVLGMFFGAHGWPTSWPMVPLGAPEVRPNLPSRGIKDQSLVL